MVCACVLAIALALYVLFDVNYFLRIGFTIGMGRLFHKKRKIFDTTTIYGICTTQDVDLVFRHMNNARYLRELDFARFHYYDTSGIFAAVSKRGGGAVQGASSTRYRRAIPIFMPYKVTTKLIYWEDKHFYLEHQFISVTDNFVRAVGLSKQTVTGLDIPVSEIIAEVEPGAQRPEIEKDLQLWISSMEESSQKYRKRD
ncbi:protein THEM6 [Hylaeus volcanicus]|uniref:protein THEM6 n=1 Tax=Hylaeus volcanicus TaxID=313075 RepID=UPI0023B7DCF9|nr:protein THEM6 [Hylaeus volcanicus]